MHFHYVILEKIVVYFMQSSFLCEIILLHPILSFDHPEYHMETNEKEISET